MIEVECYRNEQWNNMISVYFAFYDDRNTEKHHGIFLLRRFNSVLLKTHLRWHCKDFWNTYTQIIINGLHIHGFFVCIFSYHNFPFSWLWIQLPCFLFVLFLLFDYPYIVGNHSLKCRKFLKQRNALTELMGLKPIVELHGI